MSPGILTQLLNAFLTVFTGGFVRLFPDAVWLLTTLATLEIALGALWWGLTNDDALVELLYRALWIGFFIWLVLQFPTLIQAVIDSFVLAGIKAGGNALTVRDVMDPSKIAAYGLTATQPIFTHLSNFSGFAAVKNLADIIVSGLSALLILLAFFVIAIQVFVTLLEFYLVSTLALILVPFGVFRHTTFIAERVFGMVVSFGIKLMVLAFVASATLPVLVNLTTSATPTFNEIFSLLLASLAVAGLAWHAPNIASGLMAGAPTLSAATAAHTALAAGAAVGAATLAGGAALKGGLAAARLAGGVVGGVSRGGLTTASAVGTAARLGAQQVEGGRGTKLLGGASGIGQLGGAAVSDSVQQLSQPVVRGFTQAVSRGRLYAQTRLQTFPPAGGSAGNETPPGGAGGAPPVGPPPSGPSGPGPGDPGTPPPAGPRGTPPASPSGPASASPAASAGGSPPTASAGGRASAAPGTSPSTALPPPAAPQSAPHWARRLAQSYWWAQRAIPPGSAPQGGLQARIRP